MLGSNDDYYPLCKPLIDNIENKNKVAIISYLMLIETIHVLRTKVIKKTPFTGESRSECDSKKSNAENIIKDFMRIINEFSKQKKILLIRPRETITDHHSKVLKKIRNYFGYIRPMSICPYCIKAYVDRKSTNECPSCGKSLDSVKEYQYKGLGHADLEHAFLAKQSSSPVFYSSDTSFGDLKGDPDFGSLIFEIIPHPSRIKS